MFRSQLLLLSPTKEQARQFAGAAGLSRFAWNWALALSQRYYRVFGKRPGYKRLSPAVLRKHWNKIKGRRFPWVLEFSKLIAEESFRQLDRAYRLTFSKLARGQKAGFPTFRKKGVDESFQVVPCGNFPIRRSVQRFNFPRIGMVKCHTPIRWPSGSQVRGRVKLKAGRWWLILSYELPDPKPEPHTGPACGIDLGCTTFATVASQGVIVEEIAPLKPYTKSKRKLKRLQRSVSRKKKGGVNRRKARRRIARHHERVANVRANFLHQFTSRLVKQYGVIVLEDLSVNGLAAGRLAGTIRDMGFSEFRRQVEYKAEVTGTKVVLADRFYPSSKTCSSCGLVKTKLGLKERVWTCERCGVTHDRDHNAAINLEKLPQGMGKVTPTETGGSSPSRKTKRGAGRRSRNVAESL